MQPIAPEPEGFFSRKIASKFPSVPRRNRRKPSASELHPAEAEFEMDEIPSTSRAGQAMTRTESDAGGKDIPVSAAASVSEFDVAMKRYDAEMKSFDRIKWVDIHLRHATVSEHSPSLLIIDRHNFQSVGFCFDHQLRDPHFGRCSFLLQSGRNGRFGYCRSVRIDKVIYRPRGVHHLCIGPSLRKLQCCYCILVELTLQSGQSASITATLAGQVISEGFINWRTPVSFRPHLVTILLMLSPLHDVSSLG